MNESLEITAELRHSFYCLSHFNSQTTGPICTIFHMM